MAEEKILKDEILEDEELEQVAGGTALQTEQTIDGLKKLGVISRFADKHDEGLVARALSAYGFEVKTHGGCFKDNEYICRSGEFAGQNVGVNGALRIIEELQRRGEYHRVS
ncbi:MAG: hypothetical protein J5809_08090 [Selenomonadaceae bacterium]|nr:hypothetical protein [Selenomonadaceae bacterium]